MSKVYSNAVLLMMLATLASVFLSIFAGPDVAKAAFIACTTLSGGLVSTGMIFLGKQMSGGNKYFSPLNFNVLAAVVCAFLALGIFLVAQDVTQFKDVVFEGTAGAVMGGVLALINGFAKKDDE